MIVDTSVFFGLYHEHDVHHEEALGIFRRMGENILLSDFMLNELASVVLRKTGIEKANAMLDTLLEMDGLVLHYTTKQEFSEILSLFRNQKNGDNLSFVDCSIIWLARHYGAKVATFDKNLQERLG
ncbi:MAG: PIN domain-containing protein [Candidatus ainarchaeum sp.]|nr:PIN domain-containing protein [Candidatus ainarchaeum sp.]